MTGAVALCVLAANANVPRPGSTPSRDLPGRVRGTSVVREEPSARHEPAILDKLEGAELKMSTRSDRDEAPPGITVTAVRLASWMWRCGLRPSDVILSVDRRRVRSIEDLELALHEVDWPFTLGVARDGQHVSIVVP